MIEFAGNFHMNKIYMVMPLLQGLLYYPWLGMMILLFSICCGVCSSWMLSGVQEAKVPNEKIATINNVFTVFIIYKFL